MKKRLISNILLTTTLLTMLSIPTLADEHEYYWVEVSSNEWMYKEGDSFVTGWRQIGEKWYYFNSDGYMAHDTTIDGYILGSDGTWDNNISNNTATETSISKKPSKVMLETVSDFSWFKENGNTYFKLTKRDYSTGVIDEEPYITGLWNIDNALYSFDENGVLQTGEVTFGDKKYLFGNDGNYIKCISDENSRLYSGYGITTKATTTDLKVGFSYDEFENPHMNEIKSYESDSYLNNKSKPTFEERILNCKTGQTIRLMDFLVYTTNVKTITNTTNLGSIQQGGTSSIGLGLLPNLIIKSKSSDSNVAFLGIKLYECDGAMRGVIPYIIAKNPGKTSIILDVNGTKTSLKVVVTE